MLRYVKPEGSDRHGDLSEPPFLVVGRIVRPHGLRGEVRVQIRTDDPQRFLPGALLLIGPDESSLQPFAVEDSRRHMGFALVKLEGVDDRSAAERLNQRWIMIPADQAMPLDPDEFFVHQLLGLVVETTDGEHLGQLVEILITGANDVYLVRGPSGEILLPDIPTVIKAIDAQAGKMIVAMIPGLRDEG